MTRSSGSETRGGEGYTPSPVTPERFVGGFLAHLRAKASDLRAYGAVEAAQTCERNAQDLEEAFRAWWLEELPVSAAAAECGYSADRLREMARDGLLPHQKGDGANGHLRIARRDLPRKTRRPESDISPIEARLLQKTPKRPLRPAF